MTVGAELTDYVLQFAGVVVTAATGWLSWKVSTWLTQKKILSEAQANELIGHNLDLVARKAIEFAKNSLQTPVGGAVDSVINQNLIVKTAAGYILPKFKETLDRLGYSPEDLDDFIRARLHLPPEPTVPASKSVVPHPTVIAPPGSPIARSS